MNLPSLSGRKPSTAALAATVALALVGGGALVSAAVGIGANTDNLRNVEQPGNDTATATPTDPPATTDSPTEASTEPVPETDAAPGSAQAQDDSTTEPDQASPVTDTETDPATDTEAATETDADTDTGTETNASTPSAAENEPPEAAFVAESVPLTAGDDEAFLASESEDPDGEIVSYEWDFGDGSTATGETVNHTYEAVGQYEVTLTVTDDDGATDTTTTPYTAGEERASPEPVICHQHEGFMVGEEIQFDGRSFVSGERSSEDIVRWEWDFGTGTVGDTTYDVGNATGQQVTHTYENWGSYTVTLTVTTEDMVTESTSIEVYVGHPNDTYCPPEQRED